MPIYRLSNSIYSIELYLNAGTIVDGVTRVLSSGELFTFNVVCTNLENYWWVPRDKSLPETLLGLRNPIVSSLHDTIAAFRSTSWDSFRISWFLKLAPSDWHASQSTPGTAHTLAAFVVICGVLASFPCVCQLYQWLDHKYVVNQKEIVAFYCLCISPDSRFLQVIHLQLFTIWSICM